MVQEFEYSTTDALFDEYFRYPRHLARHRAPSGAAGIDVWVDCGREETTVLAAREGSPWSFDVLASSALGYGEVDPEVVRSVVQRTLAVARVVQSTAALWADYLRVSLLSATVERCADGTHTQVAHELGRAALAAGVTAQELRRAIREAERPQISLPDVDPEQAADEIAQLYVQRVEAAGPQGLLDEQGALAEAARTDVVNRVAVKTAEVARMRDQLEAAIAARDDAIRAARREKVPFARLETHTRLSRAQLAKIVKDEQ